MPTVRELPDAKEFSKRLNKVLRASGYGVRGGNTRLAAEYGVKPPVVTEWRMGKYLPSPAKVKRMARDWHVSENWLYWGEGQEPSFDGRDGKHASTPAANAAQDIDVLRYAVSVLFAATAAFRPEAAKKMAATIRAEKRPEFAHLVEDRFVQELLDALDADVRKTKTRRSSR